MITFFLLDGSGSILAGYPIIPPSGDVVVDEPLPEIATGQHTLASPVAVVIMLSLAGTFRRVSSSSVPQQHFLLQPRGLGSLAGLLEDARALLGGAFLPEGSVLCPVLGDVVRRWPVWSPFLRSHLPETSHTFLRMPSPSWRLWLVSYRPVSCPGSESWLPKA